MGYADIAASNPAWAKKLAAANSSVTKKPASAVVAPIKKVVKKATPLATPIEPVYATGGSARNATPATPTETAPAWSLETDPTYRAAMASGLSSFNFARNAALAEKQTGTSQLGQERQQLDVNATEARRRLAGSYASRGMAGGAAGALTQAEARANAEQVTARTSISDQISALNNQFLQNYGDVTNANFDWTGTLVGQQYKTQAAQQALEAALAKYGSV